MSLYLIYCFALETIPLAGLPPQPPPPPPSPPVLWLNALLCRSLARVQERDVLCVVFEAAKEQGLQGGGIADAAARFARGLSKSLGVSC